VVRASGEAAASLIDERHQLSRLAFADPLTVDAGAAKPRQALTAIAGEGVEVYLPLEGVIDLEAEVTRLEKELQQVERELRQTRGKLDSPGFIQKAPPEIVSREQARFEERLSRQGILRERLRDLAM
jgi:valyl-tRNA synthetase